MARQTASFFKRRLPQSGLKSGCETANGRYDLGPPRLGVSAFFENNGSGPLAMNHPVTVGVKGPAGTRRIVEPCETAGTSSLSPTPVGEFESSYSRRFMTSASPRSMARAGLHQGRQPRGSLDGDRIVGASCVAADGDVAGGHVGQILEHPERKHFLGDLGFPNLGYSNFSRAMQAR